MIKSVHVRIYLGENMRNIGENFLQRQIKKAHIAVIGDIMLDRYITGTVDRISPEAPVRFIW